MGNVGEKTVGGIFLKLSVAVSLFFVFLFSCFLVTRISYAQALLTPEQEKELKDAQNQKEDQLDMLKDKIKTYEKIVNLKDKEHDQLLTEAEKLDAQSSTLEKDITSNERRLGDLKQQIESIESRIGEMEEVISSERQLLMRFIRSYSDYQIQASNGASMLLASADEFKSLSENRDHSFEAWGTLQEVLKNITEVRNTLLQEQDLANKKRVEVASVKFQLEQQNLYLENAKRNKETLAANAQSEQTKYGAIISDLEKQRKEIEDEIEQLDAARAGKIDLSSIPNFSNGILGYPVKDPKISQKYGKTTFTKWYTFHNGIDFADASGTPVFAAESGTVLYVRNEGKYAYGKWIAIQHKNGLTTLYGHFSKQLVREGEIVKRGQKIGLMGNTGYSTGPHTHFSVFPSNSFELVESEKVKGLMIPTGASINPANYL